MDDINNTTGNHNNENDIKELMDVARIMTVNSNELNDSVETIIASCNTQGTIGDSHKNLLLRKTDCMKKSVILYRSVARKYESAAMKLADGTPVEKIWTELLSYNVFIRDQIRSEQGSYEQVLSILRV